MSEAARPPFARLSEVDTRRFGKRIFRAEVHAVSEVAALDALAHAEGVDMVITRAPVEAFATIHALEAAGHRLMDTLVYYSGSSRLGDSAPSSHPIRPAVESDRDRLHALVSAAFSQSLGHYWVDPRLDPRLATLGYAEWCLSSLGAPGRALLVATAGDELMGFIALTYGNPSAEITLNAVAPPFQRRGVYDSLFKAAGRAAWSQGCPQLSISTQLSNLTPQRVWSRNGLLLERAVYTFHKWFDP